MLAVRCCDWRQGEWHAAFRALVKGSAAPAQLQQQLQQYYQQPVVLLNSARAGIRLMLEEWRRQRPQCHTVLYPAYICDSVPLLITKMGLQAQPLPVNAELNLCAAQLPAYLDARVLAVIAPHMYGAPAAIGHIEQLCRQAGIFLLDDAAQICGVAQDQRPLGTFGDAGVLSFAQAKSLVSGVRGSGGALICRAASQPPVTPPPSGAWHRLGALWHFYASYQSHELAGRLDYLWQRLGQKAGFKKADPYGMPLGISTLDAAIVLRQWQSLPERQQQLRQQAHQLNTLAPSLQMLRFPQLQDERVLTRLILQSQQLPPAALQHQLATQGIASKKVYANGSRPYDGSAASGLLELPWQALSGAEFTQLLSAVQRLDLWCQAQACQSPGRSN